MSTGLSKNQSILSICCCSIQHPLISKVFRTLKNVKNINLLKVGLAEIFELLYIIHNEYDRIDSVFNIFKEIYTDIPKIRVDEIYFSNRKHLDIKFSTYFSENPFSISEMSNSMRNVLFIISFLYYLKLKEEKSLIMIDDFCTNIDNLVTGKVIEVINKLDLNILFTSINRTVAREFYNIGLCSNIYKLIKRGDEYVIKHFNKD